MPNCFTCQWQDKLLISHTCRLDMVMVWTWPLTADTILGLCGHPNTSPWQLLHAAHPEFNLVQQWCKTWLFSSSFWRRLYIAKCDNLLYLTLQINLSHQCQCVKVERTRTLHWLEVFSLQFNSFISVIDVRAKGMNKANTVIIVNTGHTDPHGWGQETTLNFVTWIQKSILKSLLSGSGNYMLKLYVVYFIDFRSLTSQRPEANLWIMCFEQIW